MASINFRPLNDRVLVRRKEEEQKTPGGIVIPDTAKEKPIEGVVVAVGRARTESGEYRELDVKVNDVVLFGKYAGTEVKLNGQEYIVMREDDIMGIVGK